jgi:hypothetical protein
LGAVIGLSSVLSSCIGQGLFVPPEIKLYRLSEAADAHRLSETRHFRGKLIFRVR